MQKYTSVTTELKKKCEFCKKFFKKGLNISKKSWEKTRFCSKDCYNKSLIGKPSWNSGIKIDREKYPNFGHFQKHTKEALRKIIKANREHAKQRPKSFYQEIQKLSVISALKNHSNKGTLGKTGELSYSWIGKKANYNSKHKWIQKHWTKTEICQNCGEKQERCKNGKAGTNWHNIDGKYDRENKESWIELCSKCHYKYHKIYG